MKKIFLLFCVSVLFAHAVDAQKMILSGSLHLKDPAQKVFLSYSNRGDRISDSADIKNGTFVFKGDIAEPTLAMLMVRFEPSAEGKRPRMERMQIYLEPGKITVSAADSLKFAKVKGSKANDEYEAYNKLLVPYNNQEATFGPRFNKFRDAKDEAGMESIREEYQVMLKEKNAKVVKPYIESHPNSPIVLNLVNQYLGSDIDPAVAGPLYEGLSSANKNSYSGQALKKRIEIAKKTAVGAMAMNFTQNDTLGRPVSLSDFKGKYVLVDFWASWCGPCRAENPNVVKAFNQYKDKNFTVLGVSLDQEGKHQAWMDAIHKDGLWWNHVSDLKFWNNAVAKQYDIHSIPQNLLIDPTGKIIAKNIRGEALGKKLQEVLE